MEFSSRFEDDPSGNIQNTSNLHDAQLREELSSVSIDQLHNLLTEPSLSPTVPPSSPDPLHKQFLEEVVEVEQSDGARCFSEDVWTSTPSTIRPCSIGGITIEAHVNPIMEVNIMPWHLAYTLLGDVTLRSSDKLLKCCPFGHIIECRGVASAVLLTLDKIEVHLDFHIFDVLDFDLLIGYPLEISLTSHQGSLARLLGKLLLPLPLLIQKIFWQSLFPSKTHSRR